MKLKVNIRRDIGKSVKSSAEQVDGNTYTFAEGWRMGNKDPYPGEWAMIPRDVNYPKTAPTWLASGDLESP